ncbi:MAG: hypothetical protein P0S93_05700 [Candidatus Neptunochlamydia sp.]|nr:hypothetical protein [Candidatus Neptunochlamydia sp.]
MTFEIISFGLIGILAGLLGIGGGIVTISLLLVFTQIGIPSVEMMHLAIGTSLAGYDLQYLFRRLFSLQKRRGFIPYSDS